MTAEHEAVVRRFFEEFCTGRDTNLAYELVTPDYVSHGPQAPPANGPGELIERVRLYQETCDARWRVDELISAGDRVIARWTGSGTHVAELMGVPATHRAISVFRMADGRIAEEWTVWDALGLLMQIGAVPAPAAA